MLTAGSLLVRVVAGPLCDLFGPRKVFGALLLLGAIPTGLAPLIHTAAGLYVVRFFMGILGGSFVPCQVWTTAFFDKNIVGSANAMTGGFGNAGGGITYFIMPAVFNGLVDHQGYAADTAWRLAFLVPLVVVLVTAVAMLVLCPDTPDGPWADRQKQAQQHLSEHHIHGLPEVERPEAQQTHPDSVAAAHGNAEDDNKHSRIHLGHSHEREASDRISRDNHPSQVFSSSSSTSSSSSSAVPAPNTRPVAARSAGHEVRLSSAEMLETARGEIVQRPTAREACQVTFSLQTWALMLTYMCSFGAELAINAVLSAYYLHNFPSLGQTGASNWAAFFGFLNMVTRPLGGAAADVLYGGRNLWWKKHWVTACGVLSGVSLVVLGCLDPHERATMFGLVALCAVFLEAGNGANFALVPHVHPFANGIVSGLTGAAGNVGGVLFSVIFRFVTVVNVDDELVVPALMDYGRALWIIGVIHIAVNVAVCWIPPIPRGQVGGH